MYLIVYQTPTCLKARYLTTRVFYNPGDYTNGGWKVLSVGYYFDKKFIDKDTYSEILNKCHKRHLIKIKTISQLNTCLNILLKVLLFIFLVKEIVYKFFIYILS